MSASHQYERTVELEEEEVTAYAEEHTNFTDLETVADQIFSWSDLEDDPVSSQPSIAHVDLDMDTGI
jgi:hypothetical protein